MTYNYIITGHRGLIGEFLKKRLDKEGHNCVLQIDQKDGFNVLELALREDEIEAPVDVFFHFAAQCKINEAIARPYLPFKNNVEGIHTVLEFCRKKKIPRAVIASTSRVLSPERNPYVASKIYTEELTKAYNHCYGLEYIIVRPSTVYGPIFDETSRLINNFLVAALKNQDLKIYGDKEKTLDFTYVDDFVEGVIVATKNKWNEDYNISGENEVPIFEVAQEVIKQTNCHSKIIFLPPEKAQPQKVQVDSSKLKKLGYTPKINIQEGIRRMIEFYTQNPDAWKKYIDRGEKFYTGNGLSTKN